MTMTKSQREAMLSKIQSLVAKKYFDPAFNEASWQEIVRLPVFNKIPRSKVAIPGLALKFLGKNSVYVHTEGLGRRPYHGRVAILVNRHTTGAAVMVAQFAKENGVAVIVGEQTPGRLVSRSAFKLGLGYRLVLPVAAHVSARGNRIEGCGIIPDVSSPWSLKSAAAYEDNQLKTLTTYFFEGVGMEIPQRS